MNLSGPIDLIKESFRIFFDRKNLTYFFKVYSLLLPFSFLFLLQSKYSASISDSLTKYVWLIPVALVLAIAYALFSFWVSASGVVAVQNVVSGGSLVFKETFARSWKILGKFALLQIAVGLLTGLGFIFLIIPGILFLVWYSFSGFEMITKDVGVGEAMGGSKRLVSGRFWKVFGRILVFGLFGTVVQIVFSFIPWDLGSVVSMLFGGLLVLPYFLLYKELSG